MPTYISLPDHPFINLAPSTMRSISLFLTLALSALAAYASPALEARKCPQCGPGEHEVRPPPGYCQENPPPCCNICGKPLPTASSSRVLIKLMIVSLVVPS